MTEVIMRFSGSGEDSHNLERVGELIRCKDCNFWMPHSQFGYDEDNGTYHDYCAKLVPEDEYYAFYRNADDYCSRGQRKEETAQ